MKNAWAKHGLSIAALLLSGMAHAQTVQSSTVSFASAGEVRLIAAFSPDGVPKLTIRSVSTGNDVAVIALGLSDPKFFRKSATDDTHVRIHFRVLHMHEMPDPLILAIAKASGGSDCFYDPVLVASINGRFRSLLPTPRQFTVQEGFALGELGSGRGGGFALLKVRWQPKDLHWGAHRFQVEWFEWKQQRGEFIPSGKNLSKGKTDSIGAATEVGIPKENVVDFEKLVSWFSDFGC